MWSGGLAVAMAAVNAPDGWQLRIEQDGSMVAVAPENLT
jgi:hypothetical protein